MKANEGAVDRVIRVLAGIGILSLYFVLEGPTRNWALIGVIPLLTGLVGYCPVYALFGFNTCPVKSNR